MASPAGNRGVSRRASFNERPLTTRRTDMPSSINYYTPAMSYVETARLNVFPGYYYYAGGSGGGSSAPPPAAAAPTPSAPAASPSSSASDLQVLIASIPIAQDGQVISAEYHNNLR